MSSPATELPADVRAVLGQLFAETSQALEAGDVALAQSLLGSARTVATNKVPPGDRRQTLLEGCDRICEVLDGEGNERDRRLLAEAYCERLRTTVAGERE